MCKKIGVSAALAMIFMTHVALAQDDPLQLSLVPSNIGGLQIDKLIITSQVDSITINDVQLNRGNCKALSPLVRRDFSPNSRALKFGQDYEVWVDFGCHLIEVTVSTDQGELKYGFSEQ